MSSIQAVNQNNIIDVQESKFYAIKNYNSIIKALSAINTYLSRKYSNKLLKEIMNLLKLITNFTNYDIECLDKNYTY